MNIDEAIKRHKAMARKKCTCRTIYGEEQKRLCYEKSLRSTKKTI